MNQISFDTAIQGLNCPKSPSLNKEDVSFTGPMTPDRFIDTTKVDLTRSHKTSTFDEVA